MVIEIELAKLLYTPFLEADAYMKHIEVIPINEDKNDYIIQGAEAHTLNLLEDLAKIEYIFADKTGTLTQNELVFKEISILDG